MWFLRVKRRLALWFTPCDRLPFITGSWAYGSPRTNSDVDLVIRADPWTAYFLTKQSEQPKDRSEIDSYAVRYGNLNLIVTTSNEAYDQWKQGTEELIAKSPVTRDEAVAHFKTLRKGN